MDIVFPKNFKVIDMIRHGARTGVSVAELQYVGLSTTVINQLENHDIIYLSDVLKLKDDFQPCSTTYTTDYSFLSIKNKLRLKFSCQQLRNELEL